MSELKDEVFNFQKTCRTCMSIMHDKNNSYNLLENVQKFGKMLEECCSLQVKKPIFPLWTNFNIYKRLNIFFQISASDSFSKFICATCSETLITSYKFKAMCKQTDMRLKNILEMQGKVGAKSSEVSHNNKGTQFYTYNNSN